MFYKAWSKIAFRFSRKRKKKKRICEFFFSISICNKHTHLQSTQKKLDFWDSFSDSDGIGWALKLTECSVFKGGTGLWKPEPFQPFLTFFSHSFFRDSALWSDIFFSSLICFSLVCRMAWDSRSRLWTTGERERGRHKHSGLSLSSRTPGRPQVIAPLFLTQ